MGDSGAERSAEQGVLSEGEEKEEARVLSSPSVISTRRRRSSFLRGPAFLFMEHPHPDKRHVMQTYRRYLLAAKRQFGTARGLGHYQHLVAIYRTAKVAVLA